MPSMGSVVNAIRFKYNSTARSYAINGIGGNAIQFKQHGQE